MVDKHTIDALRQALEAAQNLESAKLTALRRQKKVLEDEIAHVSMPLATSPAPNDVATLTWVNWCERFRMDRRRKIEQLEKEISRQRDVTARCHAKVEGCKALQDMAEQDKRTAHIRNELNGF